MKFEDAFYFKILLQAGLTDGYDEWLDGFLEAEDPLSDIVLKLALCGSDTRATVSCLHNYCAFQEIDEAAVCERLRLFLKDAYHTNRLSKEETVLLMDCFANIVGDPGDFDIDQWNDMYYMRLCYNMAQDGSTTWEYFDEVFLSYLNDGVPLIAKSIYAPPKQKPAKWIDKLKQFFCKKVR